MKGASRQGRDWLTRGSLVKLVVTSCALAVFLWLSSTSIQNRILGVILLALVLWSLYPRHYLVTSIAVIALLSLFEAALSPQEFIGSVFSTYGQSGLWIVLSGFILSTAMEVSGLAHRIAFWIVEALGGDPNRVVLSVALANLAIAPLSPSTTAKAFMILPICDGLIEAFEVKKGSRYGAAVMLMAMAANNIASTAFLTATVPNPISAGYIREASGINLGWPEWLKMALPLTAIILVSAWLVCRLLFKPEVKKSPEAMARIRELTGKLGPMSRQEKLVSVVFSISLVLWITERQHGLNGGLISLVLCLLLFLPGIGVLGIGGFAHKVPWGSIVLFAASMFLARAVTRWRALDPIAAGIFHLFNLSKLSTFSFIALMVLLSMLLHIAFTSTSLYGVVMVPIAIGLAELKGLSLGLLAIPVAFLTPLALILPVNTIPNIIFFSSGYFTQKQMFVYGVIVSLVSVIVILLVGLPIWSLQGLMQL